MKLSAYAHGRDNNFNLVRILAALVVLYSHSFALAQGNQDAEPFRRILGVTAGTMAVDLFFVTSGFLITGSLLARDSLIEFLWARVLRIYPALLAMLLLTVFGLGLWFTSVSAASYLGDPGTWIYLVKNATLVKGVSFHLPGVFGTNPYKDAVNGSLWTMPLEICMYALLALAWFLARAASKSRAVLFRVAILAAATLACATHLAKQFSSGTEDSWTRLLFMFFTGASFHVLKERIHLSRAAFWTAVVVLSLSATDKRAFFVVYDLVIAYVLFFLAFVPAGKVRAFNRVGDYSYGVYIYAFPVQQSVAALTPGISVAALFFVSAAVTLLLAALSWHLLERQALGWKRACVDFTRLRLSGTGSTPSGTS